MSKDVKKEPKSTLEGVVCSNPGEKIAPVYKRVWNEERKANLVTKVDETNVYEFIQASKSETDLATLQKRFIALGEIPSEDPTLGSNDLAVMPGNIHELYKMVNDVNKSFKALPESIQNIFGTAEVYGQSLMDGSYSQKLNDGIAAIMKSQQKIESEVKTNE